jgi:hypothetical protein
MDCPVCKCPNPPGATHCNMCYEVFNRSAAQAYLQAVKREHRQQEEQKEDPQAVILSEHVVEEAKAVMRKVDWQKLYDTGASLLRRYWKILAGGAGLMVLWMLFSFLFSADLWFHLFGKKLTYAYRDQTPMQYLVGFKQHIKIWSERQGRLDTPIEDQKIDEMGNVILEKVPGEKTRAAYVHSREWIQILNDTAGSASHVIPKNHPSLAGGRIILNEKGVVQERRFVLSPRLGKSLPFLSPRFPQGSLRHHRSWDESIEWLDVYDDWKIYWAGTFHWTLGELEPCGQSTCAELTYTADLVPHLRGSPGWAHGIVKRAEGNFTTDGRALFDYSHKRLADNTFAYDGLLHIPITKLERIPWEIRIGRRVTGPGEIVIRLENKIEIRSN